MIALLCIVFFVSQINNVLTHKEPLMSIIMVNLYNTESEECPKGFSVFLDQFESVAQLEYGQLKTVNCAAKSTHQDNYAIIFSNRNVLEKVIITMDDNLLKELTLRMPSKVNTDERK